MKLTNYTRLFSLFILMIWQTGHAQLAFKNDNARLVKENVHSGCAVTIIDWNGDGLNDIIRLYDGHDCYVEVRTLDQKYVTIHLGDFGSGNSAWAMTCADIDHNGYVDVVADGPSAIGILKTNNTGTGGTISWLPNTNYLLQNATFADFNNDGWIDLYCCDDNAASHMYLNDGAGNLTVSSFINFNVYPNQYYDNNGNPSSNPNDDPFDSGNYGSVCTDFDNDGDLDLFIAHCRLSSTSTSDIRRKDRLFVNDGNNNFTEQSSAYGIEVGGFVQTWTASFGDIDNDGDLDLLVTNHDVPSQILENDGTGHYTDITSTTGFDISSGPNPLTSIESVMEDFDNDGYLDILISGSDSRFFHNNGNKTFTLVNNLFDANKMESFAIGDLNHDGFVDIYSSYAKIYTTPTKISDVLWINTGNANHFITLSLAGTNSNHSAIGARALLYSTLGTQIREVRAGESYGTCNSQQLHFGLGNVTQIDSIVVKWPAGGKQTIYSPGVDQFITVIENDCSSPPSQITASGPLHVCPGQTLTLAAPSGVNYNYLWSDGSTTQSITVSQKSGEYNVSVNETGNNCIAVSPVLLIPDESAGITASGDIEFCNGQSVDLTGPAGLAAYSWSQGGSSQFITVNQSGTYTLQTQGFCDTWTSNPITVTVHTAIPPNGISNVTIPPGSTQLNATGSNISWFDALTGGTLLGTGNIFTTPVISNTTVFYVQSADQFGGGMESVGIENATNTFSATTTNAKTFFTVAASCTLATVKVYPDTAGNLAGNRLIELRDSATGAVIHSQLVNILPAPDSQIITLNFPLTPGNSYILGTNTAVNISSFNVNSPRLRRNNTGVTYPYQIQNVLSINGSDQGSTRYYYFYDWKVDVTPNYCPSARLADTVYVTGTSAISEINGHDIKVYPNPAKDILNIVTATPYKSLATLCDQAGRILRSKEFNDVSNKLDISGIAAGIYLLKIQSDNNDYIYKIIVE